MQIGIVGLGRMGANIGRRLMSKGHQVVGYDREPKAVAALDGATGARIAERPGRQTVAAPRGLGDAAGRQDHRRHGRRSWARLLRGRHASSMAAIPFSRTISAAPKRWPSKGITYLDCGTSGGVWGLERGYCMMIGGDKAAVDRLDPIFSALAPGAGTIDKTPGRDGRDPRVTKGYMHAGPAGSGHFVKMVHNGIEYGLMQAYAEGFDILGAATSDKLPEDERFELDVADIAEVWRRGSVVASWLLDLTAIALAKSPRPDGIRRQGGRFRRRPLDDRGGDGRGGGGAGDHRRALCPLPLPHRPQFRREAAVGHAQRIRRPCRKHHARRTRRRTTTNEHDFPQSSRRRPAPS